MSGREWTASRASLPAPDSLLIGVQHDGVYWIYASTTLSRAALEAKTEEPPLIDPWDRPGRFQMSKTWYEVFAVLDEFVLARGRDYGEALRTLLTHWQPGQGKERIPIDRALPAIDRASP